MILKLLSTTEMILFNIRGGTTFQQRQSTSLVYLETEVHLRLYNYNVNSIKMVGHLQ